LPADDCRQNGGNIMVSMDNGQAGYETIPDIFEYATQKLRPKIQTTNEGRKFRRRSI